MKGFPPDWIALYVLQRVVTNVGIRCGAAGARNPQHVERLERAICHQGYGVDRSETDRVRNRQMSGQAPYHRIQRADADALIGIMVEPDVEQLDEIVVDPWRLIAVRCVRWKDVELFDAEIVDDILKDALRIRARIAHRDKARLDPGRPEEFDAAQGAGERAPALEIHPVLVVDVRRTVQAHSDTHVMSLEQ